MKKIQLKQLSTAELNALKKDIEAEIQSRSARHEAVAAIKQLAAEKGIGLEELMAELGGGTVAGKTPTGRTRKLTGPAPIRYRHPKDSSLEWSGRGKTPKWYQEALSQGFSEASLKVY